MFKILFTLMLIAALSEFGMTLSDARKCHSRACMQTLEKHSRDVLKIDWKPISVFPEEAKWFR
jgi:hypothetical protein